MEVYEYFLPGMVLKGYRHGPECKGMPRVRPVIARVRVTYFSCVMRDTFFFVLNPAPRIAERKGKWSCSVSN